jgi:two-component system, NtrC family, sensor kinase
VENRFHTSSETHDELKVHFDPEIINDFPELKSRSYLDLSDIREAAYRFFKREERLWVQFPDGNFIDYPYYLKNIDILLKQRQKVSLPNQSTDTFNSFIKSFEAIEKKIYSSASLRPGESAKDLWDEVIKKVNSISAKSHTLKVLVENILEIPFLNSFQNSIILLHLKGQTQAELLGTKWRGERANGLIEVKDFNAFFNSIKKSKIKSFSTDAFPRINLPFNGSFLAKELLSKKYSLVAIVSRQDFLQYVDEEIELFETCINLLQPHFERLIDQEFSDKKISELLSCIKNFPLPLRIKDSLSGHTFTNDLFEENLLEKDIFYNKQIYSSLTLDLYDSDDLRHYAFDLFHFQRISLLGELLNTLRHELSNPLFGLKLSSEIYKTFHVDSSSKEIMSEIEKNVKRCQIIIENFSNLYQFQSEQQSVSIQKIIDESLVLSKSETREVYTNVVFADNSASVEINVPLIFVVQILFNLIVNAAQAMRNNGTKGHLEISTFSDEFSIYVDVLDNGPGISEENLFKPFFTTKKQGTGLGLVLSRNLAQKMGGNLEYLVNNNISGAHFRLTLPKK